LEEVPDPATIVVQVALPGGGLLTIPPSDWIYDPATGTVEILAPALPPGSIVYVLYDL
jgi:hypothetical protein